jgi:outer membrane protein TolC
VPFDRFFAEANDAWHAVETAQRELPDARAALARRLGLPEDAASDVLGARLRERTARLAQEGLTLELEFTGVETDAADDNATPETEAAGERASAIPSRPPATPTATLRTPGREPEARELRVLEVLAQAALSAALTYAEMSSVQRRIQALRESVAPLRGQLDAAFPDASQRARARQELSDAEAQLEPLHERARSVANAADILISILDEGANTVGTTARRRPLRDAPPRDAAGRPPGPRDAPTPADRPARPAAAKPSAPAEGTRDFEP